LESTAPLSPPPPFPCNSPPPPPPAAFCDRYLQARRIQHLTGEDNLPPFWFFSSFFSGQKLPFGFFHFSPLFFAAVQKNLSREFNAPSGPLFFPPPFFSPLLSASLFLPSNPGGNEKKSDREAIAFLFVSLLPSPLFLLVLYIGNRRYRLQMHLPTCHASFLSDDFLFSPCKIKMLFREPFFPSPPFSIGTSPFFFSPPFVVPWENFIGKGKNRAPSALHPPPSLGPFSFLPAKK